MAGLLETLADKGFSNASAAKDDWQMRWWEQAQCLASMLERAATEMKADADAIYSIVYDIRHRGARTMAAPNTQRPKIRAS